MYLQYTPKLKCVAVFSSRCLLNYWGFLWLCDKIGYVYWVWMFMLGFLVLQYLLGENFGFRANLEASSVIGSCLWFPFPPLLSGEFVLSWGPLLFLLVDLSVYDQFVSTKICSFLFLFFWLCVVDLGLILCLVLEWFGENVFMFSTAYQKLAGGRAFPLS